MDGEIDVRPRADGSYDVAVHQAAAVTRHVVTVPPGLAAELGHPGVDPAQLVEWSFAFLLEREPAGSILGRFGLEVIERYFPEYREEMRRHLA